ncbi:WD repeat-containing protein on Y chromosome isoform X1 [Hylaeus volcanicus]|uniref:WD repeat-containing protein on Y chromosome isoform X1 n=1 Tax=Hylaeus volcanicus TaxID=313075 RepID=UPI0023B826E9|nr:WD repeat-containing protein on Y chromosome isoform X1 [Hylaeus volcanicus]
MYELIDYFAYNPICINQGIQQAFDDFFKRKSIEEQCTEESLIRLHEAFLTSESEEMNISQLYDAFENILHIKLSMDEFEILFKKVNLKRDGNITWDEFISYLLVEFQKKDTALQWQILQLPITSMPQLLKSHHRTPIHKIIFCPEVLSDRTIGFQRGCYLTVTKEGIINYWSLDLEYVRGVQSVNPYLRVQQTLITDMIVMPDVQIVCTSSTECDLRFYDTVARKFDLRVMISGLEKAVTCMNYYFSKNIKEDSYIVLGDMNGSIKIISFCPVDRGPFSQEPQRDTCFIRYEAVLKGEFPGMKVTEFKKIHTDWVKQVAYYDSLKAFVSSSRCCSCSLLISDLTGSRIQYRFKVNMGISCFTVCEESQTLVTGGPDCIVRVWNPFVTRRANSTFQGHHAAICALVTQNTGKRVYSLSKDRCIKVWDVLAQSCIQTYNGLPSELGEHTSMTIVYNSLNHKMIIASTMIAVIICEPIVDQETSDGFTHTKPVSCVLYNHLYKVVVSTGLDSCIIVWDPWLGNRLYLVTHAHSQFLYGQYHDVEITAACFDESEQLLVTGARDGTLKIWNFNTGTCLRNMAVENNCEITSLAWVESRVLSSGWNRQVIEFAISDTNTYKKSWGVRHTDDILCSAIWYPQVLATATYNGEIILWRLETGQPYRKYKVYDPMTRFNVKYEKSEKTIESSKFKENEEEQVTLKTRTRSKASKHQESILNLIRTVAVRAMIFLSTRPTGPNIGTLLVSLDSGLIQVWSHHPAGGFLEAFSVIHSVGDCALSLTTDPENRFLVTGHNAGYIKVWYLANYLTPNSPKTCMPLLRLEFPFLWKDKINGRAKRAVRNQALPLLLSSVRGHDMAVMSVQIIPDARIIASGSTDRTVRLWTLGGRYISTFGTCKAWLPILPTIPAYKYFHDYRLPPDIKRFASFTTMKVLKGGVRKTATESETDISDFEKALIPERQHPTIDGRKLTISVMNKSVLMLFFDYPVLDGSLPYIPIYTHLKLRPLEIVKTPKLPSLLEKQKELTQEKDQIRTNW